MNFKKKSIFLLVAIFIAALIPFTKAHSQGTWSKISSIGFTPREGLRSSVINGKIYASGGIDSSGVCNIVEVYDPSTDTWSKPLTTGVFKPRTDFTSSVSDSKIFVFGGSDTNEQNLNDFQVFDPSSNSWSTPSAAGKTFDPRWGLTSGVADGKIYVFGGYDARGGGYFHDIHVFDPSNSMWDSVVTNGDFVGGYGVTSSVVAGKIYAIDGYNESPQSFLQVFDPATNTWTEVIRGIDHLPGYFWPSVVFQNKIYVIGDTGEVYDPALNSWSKLQTSGIFVHRIDFTASVIGNQVFVIGGISNVNDTVPNQVLTIGPLSVNKLSSSKLSLSNYPDPTPSRATISFTLPEAGMANLTLTDAAGRETPLLHSAWLAAGPHEVTWDASKYPSGVYLCRLMVGGQSAARRVVVLH